MTVKQVAASEGVSERQIQRYISQGFQGHILPAVRVGKAFQITEADYRAWRVACGFDAAIEAQPVSSCSVPNRLAGVDSCERPAPSAAYPLYPHPACPGGPITNVPHPTSGNMPHPLACRDYMQEQARKQKAQIRGYENEN